MKIEELIQLHNEALDRGAGENIFLNQRIKARLRDRGAPKPTGRRFPLKKAALVYGFLFIVFTFINFILIDGLKKQGPRPGPANVMVVDSFQPTFPGSISRAYAGVMK